jgi:hypothetical protein
MRSLSVALGAVVLSTFGTSAVAMGANRDQNLKAVTAQQVMQDTHHLVKTDDIQLHDVKRGWTRVTWQATTPNGEYACQSDDMVRNPSCVHLDATK